MVTIDAGRRATATPTRPARAVEVAYPGWPVTTTADGPVLVTDTSIGGVELPAVLSTGVRVFMRANRLIGPVLETGGTNPREIHLVTGLARGALAADTLRDLGVVVHCDGATIALPAPVRPSASPRWAIGPNQARWLPPLVAVAAAVRAVARADTPIAPK